MPSISHSLILTPIFLIHLFMSSAFFFKYILLSIYLRIFIYFPVFLVSVFFIHLSICQPVFNICLSIHLFLYLLMFLCLLSYSSIYLSICQSICLSFNLFTYLYVKKKLFHLSSVSKIHLCEMSIFSKDQFELLTIFFFFFL